MEKKRIAVFDFNIPQLLQNKIFQPDFANKISHTILPICHLHRQALSHNIEFVTPDVFLSLKEKPKEVSMVSHLVSPFTLELLRAGVKPLLLTCEESPFVATGFYARLKKISSQYKNAMVFSGMKKQLSARTNYHTMYFPISRGLNDLDPLPFEEKFFLTMVSGNKRVSNLRKNFILKFLYGWQIHEIYGMRQRVIDFFANSNLQFDLYGMGWQNGGRTLTETANIKKVYRGAIEDKFAVLRQYKFVFCFENSVFPGYVTEKIFDAFSSGCVPIYLGAPDIEKFVPLSTFVDLRGFRNLNELAEFLSSMDKETYLGYMEAIAKFFASKEFALFTQEHFVGKILNMLV